ncbi:MAG: glycosyl hydrolase [Paludibacter sp.]|nr:glycosyl hydrolase [Paludibacter sp.]
MKKIQLIILLAILPVLLFAQSTTWPEINTEMLPGTRWWWLGNAVDKGNLTYNLEEYAHAGIGTVEITPIYGVQHNESNEIQFLSPKWMEMLQHTVAETKRVGMQTDMNTGTGWPFGGPEVTIEDAASKLLTNEYKVKGGDLFSNVLIPEDKKQQGKAKLSKVMAFGSKSQCLDLTYNVKTDGKLTWKAPGGEWTIIAVFCGKTLQKVKRAAPGGEGYVMDHFSKRAVKNYLNRFDKAFASTKTPYPHNFFNDSYEVYGADWTEDFFEQFFIRRGYKLEEYLPEFLSTERTDITARLVSDYRETLSDLILENFTNQWTDWAHLHGSKTRNQAHGSPGNLIDLYATVDVPECESFGISDFGIKGLRKDSLTIKNFSDISMLKYASSAAHISGKPYTSSETFTWLTEHFRTSLSQCKPDLDLLFVSGVNHCYFQGTPYSPKEAAWPGWQFYASVNISPNNTIWYDAPAMFSYITRCQSFLQLGKPDNDFLIYLPVYDAWNDLDGRLLQFDIHKMEKRMPQFIHTVQTIYQKGYDVDYISDRFILSTKCINGKLVTQGGSSYEALILPAVKKMPVAVLNHLLNLAEQGAKIVFMDNFPNDVPGYSHLPGRRKQLKAVLSKLDLMTDFNNITLKKLKKGEIITGKDIESTMLAIGRDPEEMKTKFGLHALRRSNDDGYHYFISALQNKDVDDWMILTVPAKSAIIFNPLTGESGKAKTRIENGKTQVYLQLKSGESLILKTYTQADVNCPAWEYLKDITQIIDLNKNWNLHFEQSEPAIKGNFELNSLGSWTDLNVAEAKINRGTGIYNTSFTIDDLNSNEWVLDLGDVRESARVIVNGQVVTTLWSVPFECKIGKFIKKGVNNLQVEVTNLPANAIADLDRKKVQWRIFKEINFVDINYKTSTYGNWQTMPSGLVGPVKLKLQQKF